MTEIIPGKSIGNISFAMQKRDVLEHIGDYTIKREKESLIVVGKEIMVWFSRSNGTIEQILAYNGYQGKFKGVQVIGSTLSELKKVTGCEWYENLDCYYFKGISGIGFELSDTYEGDDYNPELIPIETVFVTQG
ncbi:MAG: hypothetical protein VZT48_11700 [Bulleidia sp.]|nr:hypothetical protein [Bulleidia sp.]